LPHFVCPFVQLFFAFVSIQALVEILLLSGGTPYANFKDLAHAWGREKGFHHVLVNSVCERRGEVERKRRSDAGRILSPEEKSAVRQKLKKRCKEVPTGTGDESEGNVKPETDETPANGEEEAAAALVPAIGDTEMAETAEMNVQEV
jgi:hypothetical protein